MPSARHQATTDYSDDKTRAGRTKQHATQQAANVRRSPNPITVPVSPPFSKRLPGTSFTSHAALEVLFWTQYFLTDRRGSSTIADAISSVFYNLFRDKPTSSRWDRSSDWAVISPSNSALVLRLQ